MTAIKCAGTGCKRIISLSTIPGGNPVALEEPEIWAVNYEMCKDCGKYFCDRCAKKMKGFFRKSTCSVCGGKLHRYSIK